MKFLNMVFCTAIIIAQQVVGVLSGKGESGSSSEDGKNVYYFAETFDQVTYLRPGAGVIDATSTKKAGDSNAWEDRLWANDGDYEDPTDEIGTVRGRCTFLLPRCRRRE
jgi:hypothetical protein